MSEPDLNIPDGLGNMFLLLLLSGLFFLTPYDGHLATI